MGDEGKIRALLQKLATTLVTEPPISYEEYDHTYQCRLCYASVPAFYRKRQKLSEFSWPDYDETTFAHTFDCPVALAQELLSLLPEV